MRHKLIYRFLWVLALSFCSCASARFNIRYVSVAGIKYLYLPDIATYYGMSHRPNGKESVLTSRYSKLVFREDKREAELNGVKVNLGHAPTRHKGVHLVSESDFKTVLNPVLRKQSLPRDRVGCIMIDPGHGGRDPGTRGKDHVEKDLALKIASYLAAELKERGYRVVLTRTTDKEVSLRDRAAAARSSQPDLFVSVHANYVGTASVRGVEVFRLPPPGVPSTYDGKGSSTVYRGNSHDAANGRLAYEVQKHIVARTKAPDRGIKQGRLYVLKEAPCPAVLVEAGFMSNRTEERRLGSSTYQRSIALGIAEGIARYADAVRP